MKRLSELRDWPPTPFPNSYWVEPGRLLAGEYPATSSRSETAKRIEALLRAGINSFIDLTGERELPGYHQDLAKHSIVHQRFSILDHSVPTSPELMGTVVKAIAAELAAGRKVYVHCRAGIGRTGMAIGCYLIHTGLDGNAALERLQLLWQGCARSSTWPSVPETEDQIRFVRSWVSSGDAGSASQLQRAEGALLGLAIGEALAIGDSKSGAPLVSGADTAMTRAVAQSLQTQGKHDPHDQLTRYVAWLQQAGSQARVPAELNRVLAVWQWSRKASPGSHDPKNLDSHTLARTLAVALYANGDAFKAAELAAEVSRPTLQSPLVLDACRIWGATLVTALKGAPKAEVLTLRSAQDAMRNRQLKPSVSALLAGNWATSEPLDGAISTLASALDAFRFGTSFEAALREALRVSSTCAALVGSLAGAYYGVRAIPADWVRNLEGAAELRELAGRFSG